MMQPSWASTVETAVVPNPRCKAGVPPALRERADGFIICRSGTLTPYLPCLDAPALSPSSYRATLRYRGLLLGPGETRALERHPECLGCMQIHACPAVFLGETPPHSDPAGALPAEVRRYPIALNLTRHGDLAAFEQFTSWVDRMAGAGERVAQRRVAVHARVDCVRLDEDLRGARLEAGTVEPHELADRVVGRRVQITSTDLPARSGRPDYLLGFAPATNPFLHRLGKLATLFILRRCTANCVMCHVQEFYSGPDMPSWRVFELIEELRVLGFDRVDFFGGEPTLRPDLPELITLASGFGCDVDIITNGMSIDDALAERLRSAGLNLAMVSLDGSSPATHDNIRGVHGGFDRATRGVRELVRVAPSRGGDRGMAVNIDTVVLPENYETLEAQVALVASLGATHVNFFLCVSAPLLAHKSMWLDSPSANRLFREILPRCRETARRLGITLSISPDVASDDPGVMDRFIDAVSRGVYNPLFLDGRRCAAAYDEIYVTLSGDVFPCTSPTMLETEHRIGNGFERPLAEIVVGEQHRRFTEGAGGFEACRMCWRSHHELRDHALSRDWVPALEKP